MTFEESLRLKRKFHQLKLTVFAESSNYLDLSIVNPDLQPEKQIIDKLLEFSLQNNAHRYSSAQGLPELRQAIAQRYENKYQVKVNWEEQVTIARGTNAAISNIFNLFYKKHLRKPTILLPVPTYSMHLELARQSAYNCCFYSLDCDEVNLKNNLIKLINENEIDILLMNFPNNPTGKIVSKNFYDSLITELPDQKLWIVNDFVYADLTYEANSAPSLLANNTNNFLFEIFSLSKSHSLAGWRLALILGHPELIKELIQNQTEIDYGSYQGFQRALAFALCSEQDYSRVTCNTYQHRWKLLAGRLINLEIEIKSDQSGCFLWCKLPDSFDKNSYQFCEELLQTQNLAIQPGEIFGENLERYFRVALTANDTQLTLAADRIEQLLKGLR